VNVTRQLTARPFDEGLAPVIYAERGVSRTTHPGKGGEFMVEPAGGVRIWKNLGAGAAFVWWTVAEPSAVRAIVPHPILFNQPRGATTVASFERSDSAIHTHALAMVPIHPRLDVALSAGPSFITVRQDVLRGIQVIEAGPPYSTVSIGDVAVLTRKVSTVGLNAGVDVTLLLTPTIGIGFTTRYVRGYAATSLSDGTPVDLDVGGLQVGVGARLRLR
jgi:hypothetical protein